jgi:hypothetical protein
MHAAVLAAAVYADVFSRRVSLRIRSAIGRMHMNAVQIGKRLHESNCGVFVLSKIFYSSPGASIRPNHSLSIYLDLKSVSATPECFA